LALIFDTLGPICAGNPMAATKFNVNTTARYESSQ